LRQDSMRCLHPQLLLLGCPMLTPWHHTRRTWANVMAFLFAWTMAPCCFGEDRLDCDAMLESLSRHTVSSHRDHLWCGRTALQAGKTEEASRHFDLAVTRPPADANDARNLGAGLYRLGRFNDAGKSFDKAIRADPSNTATRMALVNTAGAAGVLGVALWHFGLASSNLHPLSSALSAAWRSPPPASAVVPESAGDWPEVYYVDVAPPRNALKALSSFLSKRVIGAEYNYEFKSSSLPVTGLQSGGLLEQAIAQMQAFLPPDVRARSKCAEWWVHRRPSKPVPKGVRVMGLEGHPLHWDNDGPEADNKQGSGRLRPLFTSLLYLTGGKQGAPAPVVVVNTTMPEDGKGLHVGDPAWVVHPAVGRIAYLNGSLLHGVLPSAGSVEVEQRRSLARRLSLNVAWWPHDCQQAKRRVSGEPPPAPDLSWQLLQPEVAQQISLTGSRPHLLTPQPVRGIFCGADMCGMKSGGKAEL